jgi:hypothetical protein
MDLLTAKCMKDKGFDYKQQETKEQVSTFPFATKSVGDNTWGTTDIGYAKIYGYLPPAFAIMSYENTPGIGGENPNWPKAPKEEQDRYNTQSSVSSNGNTPEYNKALTDDNGCINLGETNFYKGLNVDASRSNQVGELRQKIVESAMYDEKLAPKLKEWSECMKPKGFNFDFPPASKMAKGSDPLTPHNPAYGEDNELVAAADAECKQKVGLIDAWHKVLDEVEEQAVKDNLPVFEAEKAYNESVIKRAQEIIEQYSGK